MNLSDWLKTATDTLESCDVRTARLDCLVLLEDITGKDRSWLLAHSEFELNKTLLDKLENQIERRSKHEPIAYIRGKTEFYGRDFFVNKHVLEPRPESETMIDLLKQIIATPEQTHVKGRTSHTQEVKITKNHLCKVRPFTTLTSEVGLPVVVDVGTGSGALAVTAKLEIPDLKVIAIDIDEKCLDVARSNAKKLNARIEFHQGNLLAPLSHIRFTHGREKSEYAVLANLPYVPDSYEINEAAMSEPRIAIFGGEDGLDLYRNMFDQIKKLDQKPEYILTESLPFQHQELAKIAGTRGYALRQTDDFIQLFKTK